MSIKLQGDRELSEFYSINYDFLLLLFVFFCLLRDTFKYLYIFKRERERKKGITRMFLFQNFRFIRANIIINKL